MAVIDVSVIKAFNVSGVPVKKSFCVYVRLQGQAMRTNTCSGKYEEIPFNERFRFQYRPERKGREKNQLFVELWTRSMLSQSCVSVAWVDMDGQDFVQGVPITFNMHGGFEGKQATVMVVVVPVDFSTLQQQQAPTPPQPQQQQPQQMYQPAEQQAYYTGGQTALGVPLETASPYTTGEYLPAQPAATHYKTDPLTGQPIPTSNHCGECEAAPLPPPGVFDTTVPPPLYGNNSRNCGQRPPAYQPPSKPL